MAQKSEFASLSDLAIKQGVPHSELLSEIHDVILYEYKKMYPTEPQTVDVVVDEKSGTVRIMKDRKDITPEGFGLTAERIAREVIIKKLDVTDSKDVDLKKEESEESIVDKIKKDSNLGKWLLGIIFWGYNLLYIFSLLVYLGNFLLNSNFRVDIIELVKDLGTHRVVFLGIAAVVPLITVFSALKLVKNKTTNKLATLFFLFEIPLVVLPLFLSNIFQNPTPIIWFFLAIFVLSIPVFFFHILDMRSESKEITLVITSLRELTLLSVGYAVLLYSFAVPLILGGIIRMISEYFVNDVLRITSSYYPRYFNPFEFLLTIFFGGIFILIVLSLTVGPYLLLLSLVKIFIKSRKELSQIFSEAKTDKLLMAVAVIWFVAFLGLSYQPNADKYIERLERLSQVNTFEEKEEIAKDLLPEEVKIKRAFEDLKNVRSRYLMAKSDNYIKDAYTEILSFGDLSAEMVQQSFVALAYPFVYQGSLDRNNLALRNFEYLFGNDLYKNANRTETKNVDLVERSVSANVDYEGLIATITIKEEYKNTLTRDQEIIYEFSLPVDSVVVDLKLGPDLEFPGIIAPKGAAGRVYQQEVSRQRDPALLEKTGPNQYRLRVFPIPARNSNIIFGKNQKVQFTYITPITFKGFGLPEYSKEQNIKTGSNLKYSINGQSVNSDGSYLVDNETSQTIKSLCDRKNPILANSKFADSSTYLYPNVGLLSNTDCDKNGISLTDSSNNLRIGFIFDVSYSNKNNRLISDAKKFIENNSEFLNANTIEVYKFNDLLSKGSVVKDNNFEEVFDFSYFGVSDWIKAINSLSGKYDLVVLLTNEDQPPLKQNISVKKDFPIYIVHEGIIPPYTSGITGELLQGGGGVFENVVDAINAGIVNSVVKKTLDSRELVQAGSIFSYYSDVNLDQLLGVDWLNISTGQDSLSKIIAKKLIDRKIDEQDGNLDSQIGFLDTLNKFAQANSVVTPYSSLIALVNERQLQNLQQQAQNMDRYKETASPTTSGPIFNPMMGASPFSGMQRLNINPGGSFDGVGGGGIGPLGAPAPGITAFNGGGGEFGFSGFSLLIMINFVILGGGLTVFFILKLKKSFKKK